MLMGIGYSAIESVTGEIEGTLIAEVQNGIFITDVEYVSDIEANKMNSKIDNFLGTMLQSTVELSKTNPKSEIKYKVTVYNNSNETVPFVGVLYDDEFYDNTEIVFEINDGFKIGGTISPGDTKEIYITFKYKDTSAVPENTTLKSYLNFKMTEPNRMMVAKNAEETGKYLTSSIVKNQIESIKFEQGKEPEYSDKIIERFDASEKQNGSIIGYYTDEDNNGLYELTFISQEIIYANKDSMYLFQNLVKVDKIQIDNLSTFGVTNMNAMFMGCESLTELKLNNFDTKNVTDITHIFASCSKLLELDLENFDTSNIKSMTGTFKNCNELIKLNIKNFDTANVISMTNMFYECRNLKEVDVSEFNTQKVTSMNAMFYQCNNLENLNIKSFDTSNVKSMNQMFFYCSKLSQIDVSVFDTQNVTDMGYMFYGCSSLEELNVSDFRTQNVKDISGMFGGMTKLKELNLNNFETDNVTNMNAIFKGDQNLKILDISKFNTKKVIAMKQMFAECYNLETIYVSEFDIETT